MTKEKEEICCHGKRVWKNYGDGWVRHFAADKITPSMQICDDPKMYE